MIEIESLFFELSILTMYYDIAPDLNLSTSILEMGA